MNNIPIWRDANQLLLLIEQTVKHFAQYHKYTLGSEMRNRAMLICRLISSTQHVDRTEKEVRSRKSSVIVCEADHPHGGLKRWLVPHIALGII